MTDQAKEEENLTTVSEKFCLEQIKNSNVKVSHKYTLGSLDSQTFCVRFDPLDKYIAQGCGDGTIRIYNVFSGKQSFVLNTEMEQPMPTTQIRWRPTASKAVTKNVIISVNANGALQHWHTTSGKLLHTIWDELNQLFTVDYNPDGTQFVTGGSDCIVRVYDEQTRKIFVELEGGGAGEPGHSNRVFCVKFDPEDPNFVISGGWDNNIKVWDIRTKSPVRSLYGPYVCGDSIDITYEIGDEPVLLSGSYRDSRTLQLWSYDTMSHFIDIDTDEGLPSEKPCLLYCCQFNKTNKELFIAGGSGSNEVKIFDLKQEFKPVAQIKDLSRACFSVDWSNSGDMFAIGGGDGVIRVFNVVSEV